MQERNTYYRLKKSPCLYIIGKPVYMSFVDKSEKYISSLLFLPF